MPSKRATHEKSKIESLLGVESLVPSILDQCSYEQSHEKNHDKSKIHGQLFILGKNDQKALKNIISEFAFDWQKLDLSKKKIDDFIFFAGKQGLVWICCKALKKSANEHIGFLCESEYSWHRDNVGPVYNQALKLEVQILQIHFINTNKHQELGSLVGLQLAAYTYKKTKLNKNARSSEPRLSIRKQGVSFDPSILVQAKHIAYAVNTARHLVNLPPNLLNPKTYALLAQNLLSKKKNIKVETWNTQRLKKEKMELLLTVGQGSESPPCLVYIRYRPKLQKLRKKVLQPIAFIGKGITFDSGGLDKKSPSAMRLMKKDMGGSAALMGLAVWLSQEQIPVPVDIYLALAENSIDGKSMRSSDVIHSRSGLTIEVDDTDAEGRLVLADVLDLAVSKKGKDEPELIIDIATLTADIKAGLGADIGGLFCNDDKLAAALLESAQQIGEPSWRMPLYQQYGKDMESPFADLISCIDGYGGAITAALFLQRFTKQKSWAHFDVNAWNLQPHGALAFAGGSGQGVQTFIQFLQNRAHSHSKD